MRVNMCVDMCVDMRVDMRVGMCVDMRVGIHGDVPRIVAGRLRAHIEVVRCVRQRTTLLTTIP